ncbi:hydrogenase accessory protein HypB [Thermodesulfatator indicus DSM 15286]|uniref:Hydrogenase accessory protein HypB n=1 Tax=Thermodesulfatator indicus (strain DSM 15286 / JCM 11887 / CIR29812) TaxID=667014 RepID=F8AE55_THEID|nr:hydrogenase nickel incorporation protein HypB [Thermodesulfatator indicus]AEH44178.1 hydrogenase accessory protein HypB [Thermodesulfatator indicus DSM 15286]
MCEHCGCNQRSQEITLEKQILAENDLIAQKNRAHFREKGIKVINLISSPGSGKTTLLEATIDALGKEIPLAVIEGDPETERDAERIRQKGVPAIQVTTGGACHLDARMVHRAYHQLEENNFKLLFIENVGNLLCPSSFDLGEDLRVVLVSVPEGSDKPAKYPASFYKAHVFLITKIDLLPYFDFDLEEAAKLARQVNPNIKIIPVSAKTREGMALWLDTLKALVS